MMCPHPRPPRSPDSCLHRDTYILASYLLTLSNDTETNLGPAAYPMHLLPLNMGGPKLNRKRWGKLLQEIVASEPMVLWPQEVCCCTGTSHVASTTQARPEYLPLFYGDVSRDMIYLVHEHIRRHCTLHTTHHEYGIAPCVNLPGVPGFLVVNQHGPFTIAKRMSFDECVSTLPLLAIVGGDSKDAMLSGTQPRSAGACGRPGFMAQPS